ncbi:MAG: ATP-binding protein [Lachnospiraceae bacterium]|nr:ATP-binding protein [Lachnospiraceae bacterium]
MQNTNPYELTFGKNPNQSISRASEASDIIESFTSTPSTQQVFMITGVRGCGKTVFMTNIAKQLKSQKDWLVIELNSSQNYLVNLAAELSATQKISKLLKQSNVNISALGVSLGINSSTNSTGNEQIYIRNILEHLKKQNKRLLICIDEATASKEMREFASAYQIFVREELPVYLLMTGLYENIKEIRDEKNLTFLYRAPEIKLKPLNIGTIAANYATNFDLDESASLDMAKLTKGYSFAFQVLGYYTYRHNGDYMAALAEYRQYLEDYSYEKIWAECSTEDKKLLFALAQSQTGKAKELKEILGWDDKKYPPYRDRLLKRQIVESESYGYLQFMLPEFDKFVKTKECFY